jgi:hypothetical protein
VLRHDLSSLQIKAAVRLRFEKDRAPLPALCPYLPEYCAVPQAALLGDSGKTSFSKMKHRFIFERGGATK